MIILILANQKKAAFNGVEREIKLLISDRGNESCKATIADSSQVARIILTYLIYIKVVDDCIKTRVQIIEQRDDLQREKFHHYVISVQQEGDKNLNFLSSYPVSSPKALWVNKKTPCFLLLKG